MQPYQFYLINNPAYIGVVQPFFIGYINSDFSLSDITSSCTITVLQPAGVTIVDTNKLVVNSKLQYITVQLEIQYSTNPIFYTEFTLVQPLANINQANIYNTFLKYLPQNVYTTATNNQSGVYLDNMSITTTLAQIYDSSDIDGAAFIGLNQVIANFFPDSGYPAWEQYLVGTNSLYLQQNTNYAALLQLFYETNINNNTNPYFLAYNISRYIYYRLGELFYVYIGEDVFSVENAFILDQNSLGACILSGSPSGATPTSIIIYVINGSSLTSQFQNELNNFVRRIVRSGVLVTVNYTSTFANFGLVNISNTYLGDPRQGNTYCIQFNPGVLSQALGYSNGGSIINITSFTITLSTVGSGTTLTHGNTYEVTITPVYSTPTTLPKPVVQYVEFFSSNYNLLTTYMSSGNEYFTAVAPGTVTMVAYLGIVSQTITYTII